MTSMQQQHGNEAALNEKATIQGSSEIISKVEDMDERIFSRAQSLLIDIKAVLEEETQALKASDLPTAYKCQESKMRMMQEYEFFLSQAQAHTTILKASAHPLKKEVMALQGQLHKIADKNHRALEKSKKATERLTNRIMKTVRRCVQNQENMAYGASGTFNGNGRGLSMNIDKSF